MSYHFHSIKTFMHVPMARFFCLILAGLCLSGCAGGPGASVAPQKDMVTDSDESEPRRRNRIRLELALGYFDQGKTHIALDEVKQALVQDPGFVDAYNLRGLIYMRLNDLRLAEESFRRGIELDPRNGGVLHNLGWLQCQTRRYAEADALFGRALTAPGYPDTAKTLLTQGICQIRAGQTAEAEVTLGRAYALDPGNPVTGYNLAQLLLTRGDLNRAQFYIRRVNNSDFANAETLWLGIKVERRLGNQDAMRQLADTLNRRFASSREIQLYEKGAFNE